VTCPGPLRPAPTPWAVGGWNATQYAVGAGYDWNGLPTLFLIGLILLLLYFPLYWWRKMEDKSSGGAAAEAPKLEGAAG